METLLITLTVLYLVGAVVWLIVHIIGYGINRDFGDDTRGWARGAFMTPVWPFYAICLLSLKLKEMWDDSGLGDDLKRFQQNAQKGAK